jgi:hypothetical protein
MAIVKKATSDDFEKVFPLLLDLASDGSAASSEDEARAKWQKFFNTHWNEKENYVGYLLLDETDSVPVGFIGVLFSERKIHNKIEYFCNLTSWIVKKEYRSNSLSLILPILNLINYTITDFTASAVANKIFKSFQFKELSIKGFIVPPIPGNRFIFYNKNISLLIDEPKIADYVSHSDQTIYHDHLPYNCHHILLRIGMDYCYIIANRVSRKKIPFLRIHYVSNVDLFIHYIDYIKIRLLFSLRSLALFMDDIIVKGRTIPFSFPVRHKQARIYRSSSLTAFDIDSLYTELILLND